MLELEWIAEGGSLEERRETASARGGWRERIAWGLSLVLLAAALTLLADRTERGSLEPHVTRLSVALPDGASSSLARVSPDGQTLALSLRSQGQRRIWLRPLDSLSSRPVPGSEGGDYPFWSPDGRYLGFFADGKLKKVDVRGGPPQVLCDAPGPFSMGSWSGDGTILFNIVETPGHDGVYRVSDAGGTPTRFAVLDESGRELLGAWPSFLPDDRHFLLYCESAADEEPVDRGLCVVSVDTGRASLVLNMRAERGSRAEYAAPGYLVYTREAALMAQAFDPIEHVVTGEPVTIAEQIGALGPIGLDNFSVSGNVLVYQTESVRAELIWKDRNGRTVGHVGSPGAYTDVSLGPDGRELAVAAYEPQTSRADIWIIELDRDVATRFTTEAGDDVCAVWSPDGRRIAFSSARDAPPFMHVKDVTSGDEQVLLPSRGTLQAPNDWSPDGRNIIYSDRDPSTDWDLWVLPLDGQRDPFPFLRTPSKEMTASFSPDGDWVAYASDESGRLEVYVTPFSDAGKRRRVSTDGGYLPYWRDDGKELFYLSLDDRLMAVPVISGPSLELEAPVALFSIEPAETAFLPYDVSADGQRFIVISALPEEATTPTVVTGWSALLPR
jgi:Tol biopolymer transport system component